MLKKRTDNTMFGPGCSSAEVIRGDNSCAYLGAMQGFRRVAGSICIKFNNELMVLPDSTEVFRPSQPGLVVFSMHAISLAF